MIAFFRVSGKVRSGDEHYDFAAVIASETIDAVQVANQVQLMLPALPETAKVSVVSVEMIGHSIENVIESIKQQFGGGT